MAANPVNALQTLQAALVAEPNTKEQADILATLRESLESHPSPIPTIVDTLISRIAVNAGDSLLKRWILDLLQFAIARSTLPLETRTQNDPVTAIVKTVVQCMTTVYPLVFRHLCQNRNNPGTWNTLSTCKARIIECLWSPATSVGVKLSAMKDTDLLSALLNSWANLARLRPPMVPILITTLKQWTPNALVNLSASQIRSVEKAVRILLVHISRLPGNSQYGPQINEALQQQAVRMERAAIEEKKRKAAGLPDNRKRPPSAPSEQPSEAKRIKLENEAPPPNNAAALLAGFDFTSLPAALITELIVANLDAFSDAALTALVHKYRQTLVGAAPAAAPQPAPTPVPPVAKPTPPPNAPSGPRKDRRSPLPEGTPVPSGQPPQAAAAEEIKEEPVDPLQMAIDDEEIEFEPEKLNNELSTRAPVAESQPSAIEADIESINLQLVDFKLPPPSDWDEDDRTKIISKSLTRIWDGADELKSFGEAIPVDSSQAGGHSATELWMLLIVRMITRVAKPPQDLLGGGDQDQDEKMKEGNEVSTPVEDFYARQDQLRQTICEYIMTDFPSRVRLATTWMNEEWYNDQIRTAKDPSWRPNYDTWLNQIVASYQTILDGKDKTFARFLLDLPSVPADVLDLLRELCVDSTSPERMQVGYTTLRGLVSQRPSLRIEALNVLLELTTHPERKTRAAAINTVKMWVPNTQPMFGLIREFALQMLRKLQQTKAPPKSGNEAPNSEGKDKPPAENGKDGHGPGPTPAKQADVPMEQDGGDKPADGDMEDGQVTVPPEDLVQTPYLPNTVDLPANKQQVLQHLELLFALSVKVPEFLEQIFLAFGKMDISVQEAIQELITQLIRSLGPNHGKLLTLLRTCPKGSENLALRVLNIFTEHGRPSAQLVALVKSLINERDLDARFLIPIIAEMDKSDIIKYLPRIVSILNGKPEPKNLVRSVFSSIVTTPPQTFGSVTSNLPRVRQSELLTPAELMVLLHESEKEIGFKAAMEAIGICFSMADVYRSEILGVVMQQIMDNTVIPTLFMRTLPKDRLKELVDKHPSLKAGLRDFVTKKAANKARQAGILDILDAPGPSASSTPAAGSTTSAAPVADGAGSAAASRHSTPAQPEQTGAPIQVVGSERTDPPDVSES
ncbi:cleavage/polyadenylation specificity factor [Coprinopsis cinerea okayama7|uniref:Cleavage/polyadenylation specificity factor n=1 Tax=Coprinopsis cinerea (strain Okayama-7 / 130 / ATCC MYA-4618 / FGSC 9003) TaxID=240176 RepID=A8N9R2_COPC7|nr:cleavage/polyadenylation specificity factor [Coprinopsis cinerea okayama7\|eukprot:XP_001831568.2 cleavage/polyadenylation specificity factor [Coprinopsis cinerea okayama7\